MISAEEFLDLLKEKDLLPEDLLTGLRGKISQSQIPSAEPPWNKPLTAARLAKWLVDNGHLSRLLAQRLLVRSQGSPEGPVAPPAASPKEPRRAAPEEDDLGLAPLEGEEVAKPAAPAARAKPRQPAKPPAQQSEPPTALPLGGSLLDEEMPSAVPEGVPDAAPLGDLVDGPIVEADALAGGMLDADTPEARGWLGLFGMGGRFRRAQKRENIWDSTLLLVGGGTLLGLVILGGVLLWAFSRQSGDQMLEAANEFYQQGSYTNAIRNYNRYLEEFPKHSGVSLARVRRGLAQLRQATDTTSNWSGALETAKGVLKEIASEEEFATEARPELSALLPKISEGLAQKAREELAPELVDKARESLELVNRYVPSSQRPVTRLEDVQAVLALTEREIARGAELDKATAAMTKAVGQGNLAEAYQIRNALLTQYPRLADNEQLREAVLAVSQAEQSAVKIVPEARTPETSERPTVALRTVILAQRRSEKAVPGAENQGVFALADGAAYGLEASTGKLLWRRPVGFRARAGGVPFPPTPIAEKAGSDVVMVSFDHHEVLRVEAATGKLRWRLPLEEEFDAHPVVADDRLLVATRRGRIVPIELESGKSPGYIQLRQTLDVAPAVDVVRSRIYQVAEHSNLFVLSLPDGEAIQTVYLGHEPGSITAPPIVISRFLVLAENDRAQGGTLRVLSLEAADPGDPPVRLLQEVRLDGYVDTPPLVSGVRLLVITDKGDVRIFEISGSKADAPLKELALGKAAGEKHLPPGVRSASGIRFPMMISGQVWIADSQLTRYDLRSSLGRLEPKGIENEGSVTIQPPVAVGRAVIHVRRKIGQPGVLVAAMPMDGGRALWETRLAAPLVAEPAVDDEHGKITAVTSTGGIFQLSSADVKGVTLSDQPTAALKAADVRRPLTDLVSLEGGLLAISGTGGPKQISVLDLERPDRLRSVFLPDSLGCRPIAFADGLVAPCQLGQVLLFDPRSGQKRMEPFQPRLESGVDVDWRGGAAVDDTTLVLASGRNKLYRIGIKESPEPHLAKLVEVDLSEPIVSPVAVLGTVVYAVDAAHTLLAFELPKLTQGQQWPLGGRCVWGPRRVGDCVMAATDDDRLCCVDAEQKMLWKIALPYGPLAGAPLATDEGYVLAAAGGVVWRVEASTGEEVAKVETGYPLATGPVPLGSRLLVGGHDGSLYEIEKP